MTLENVFPHVPTVKRIILVNPSSASTCTPRPSSSSISSISSFCFFCSCYFALLFFWSHLFLSRGPLNGSMLGSTVNAQRAACVVHWLRATFRSHPIPLSQASSAHDQSEFYFDPYSQRHYGPGVLLLVVALQSSVHVVEVQRGSSNYPLDLIS